MTSATADASELGYAQHACDTGSSEWRVGPVFRPPQGVNTQASGSATAAYGMVSAFVWGGAIGPASLSSSSAMAEFTDTLTFLGGSGKGVLTIVEAVV